MSDIIDRANAEAERLTANAINNARLNRCDDVAITEIIDPITHQSIRVCSDCDVLIPIERIAVQPTAALCIDCQSLREERKYREGTL